MAALSFWDGRLEMTTAEIAAYIRCEDDAVMLTGLANAAYAQICRFLGGNKDFLDCDGYEQDIPEDMPLIIKRLCSSYYENRRDDVSSQGLGGVSDSFGEQPHSALEMLRKYRHEVGF